MRPNESGTGVPAVQSEHLDQRREAVPRFDRAAPGGALVAPSGRPITQLPRSWRAQGHLAVPPGGGELILPNGSHAVAEPVSSALEAFVVHAVETKRSATAKPLLKLSLLGRDRALMQLNGEATELRRDNSQVWSDRAVLYLRLGLADEAAGDDDRPGRGQGVAEGARHDEGAAGRDWIGDENDDQGDDDESDQHPAILRLTETHDDRADHEARHCCDPCSRRLCCGR
jgi:hypothetical protein